MAFGNRETKEEKQERKTQELLQKYGLQELTDERDLESVRNITASLAGNKLISLGSALAGRPYETADLTYRQAIVEQNFVIIRQLSRILEKLEK